MKKLFTALLVMLAGTQMTYAQTAEEAAEVLRLSIPEINKSFPINASVVTMDSVAYVAPDLVYYITVDEKQVSVKDYEAVLEQSATTILSSLMGSNDDNPELYNALVKSGSNVAYELKGSTSGSVGRVAVSNQYIRVMAGDISADEAMDMITEYVAQANSTLPQNVGDGMTFTKMVLEDNYIVNYFDTDESSMSIQAYQDYKEKGTYMEESIMESLKSLGNAQVDIMNRCILISGCGMRYVYYGTQSEISVSFDITPQMFRENVMGEGNVTEE